MAKKIKMPTFLEQANAIIDNNFKDNGSVHGMTIDDHKLICKILDAHEGYVDEKVINGYREEIAKYYNPIVAALDKIDQIAEDVRGISNKIGTIEGKVAEDEVKIAKQEITIQELRRDFEDHRSDSKAISDIKPVLETLQRIIGWWNRKNWFKIAAIIAGILFVMIAIFIGIVFYMHKEGWVSQDRQKQGYNKQWTPEYELRVLNAPVRSGKTLIIPPNYTQQQKDFIKDAKIESNEHEIENQIARRNQEYKEYMDKARKGSSNEQ